MIRFFIFTYVFVASNLSFGQDTAKSWFLDGDEGFYGYLADRMQGLGHEKPSMNRNGESVVFEFWVTDSGWIDSVRILQCMNVGISNQLRMILNTMPRVNATVAKGKTVGEKRVYNLIAKQYLDGYRFEPNSYISVISKNATSPAFKYSVVVISLVAILIAIIQ